MKRTLTALTVSVTMFASSAYAFDPADLQKLMDTNECVKCDLSGANLEGANLMDANLSGANVTFTYMNRSILCNTTMPDGSVIYSGC